MTSVGGPPSDVRGVPWQRARHLAHAAARPLGAVDLPLDLAAGLTLARELVTRTALPAFDTSAMDGFGVAGPGPWRIRGTVRAGTVWTGGPLRPGEAVAISTGACVPPGADSVLPVEVAERAGDLLTGPDPRPGGHIRRLGEDAAAGTVLAPPGTPAGPALLGLAATCGHDTLRVRPRPGVRLLVTGDELVRAGEPGPGRIRDALGPSLPSLVTGLGGEPLSVHEVEDAPGNALAEAVEGAGEAQVIVVTGSTSVGTTDALRRLLHDHEARWIVDTVACRPGHPQLLAELPDGRLLLGLPGNPYAALVAAHTLLAPLLAGLAGRGLPALPMLPLTGEVPVTPGRTRLLPVVWAGAAARVLGGHGAAFLNGAALADALAAVPPGWNREDPVPLIVLR
ncbi:molybdopterin molybdotransferase MoeA [Actinocorallia longicatena]|uniref:Molybdopterin molybdenumtransferase n=1 Tax=Actinocorallia longicatena TaxID=111803 RepID=A0ABP6Q2S4_9ACTN